MDEQNKKSFGTSSFIIILVIVLVACVAGAISYWKINLDTNESAQLAEFTPLPEHVTNQVSTSDWKTYESPARGFTIRYPATYEVIESSGSVLLRREISDIGSSGSVEIFSETDSVKNEIANHFISGTSTARLDLRFATNPAVILNYFTGSANDLSRTYIFANDYPSYPGDDGAKRTGILRVHIEQGLSDAEFQSLDANQTQDYSTIPWETDQIVATLVRTK